MTEYNISSITAPVQIVWAGNPETLIINHSTKNTVYIGNNNMIGSGNLADVTPLDPYASIVVNGQADVWAVAATANQPCQVLTQTNALNWTPKAIQPNIVDPQSPHTFPAGTNSITLNVPNSAQGLALYDLSNVTGLVVSGPQSGITYYNGNPNASSASATNSIWVPVLSDVDASITVQIACSVACNARMVWIMNGFAPVQTGQVVTVDVGSISGGPVPVINSGASILNVDVVNAGTAPVPVTNATGGFLQVENFPGNNLNVVEQSKHMWANQQPVPFDLNLAANAVGNIIPAAGGVTLILHDLRVEVVTPGAIGYAMIQDTSGTNLANIFMNGNAATDSPAGNNNFHGAVVTTGLGLQLKNNTVAAQRYVGYVTYSQ